MCLGLPGGGLHCGRRRGRRLYALDRMVQVLHVNMHRIYDLWGIFLSHVLEVRCIPIALRDRTYV